MPLVNCKESAKGLRDGGMDDTSFIAQVASVHCKQQRTGARAVQKRNTSIKILKKSSGMVPTGYDSNMGRQTSHLFSNEYKTIIA
ncbi:hypothetical protein RRG08_064023 [Elysia crispata]|uniref:Uncharacterized protein n=1 Tax=Elysia crispata TaxID=231223 RepID=A0AAE0YF66_9GAST|nr:hypothetical protein RRG08_064023 [Elysia crispata]